MELPNTIASQQSWLVWLATWGSTSRSRATWSRTLGKRMAPTPNTRMQRTRSSPSARRLAADALPVRPLEGPRVASVRVIGALLMVAESLMGTYLGFIAFMLSGWMIDDNLAFRLTDNGWAWIAVQRLALWVCVGLAYGAVIVGVNRIVMPRLGLQAKRASFWLGLVVAAVVLACGWRDLVRRREALHMSTSSRPNTRMQRTRSSPSALRSPLMRCPLGGHKEHL